MSLELSIYITTARELSNWLVCNKLSICASIFSRFNPSRVLTKPKQKMPRSLATENVGSQR